MASGAELTLIGDVGGFGAGSDFSWQTVATYGFDVDNLARHCALLWGIALLRSTSARMAASERTVSILSSMAP